jgi:hypothetical protein
MTAAEFGFKSKSRDSLSVFSVGQYILNFVAAAALRAADRRRLAALPRRYLDDAGLTLADLDAALPGMHPSFPRNAERILSHTV